MSSGDQQPQPLENFLIVAYRSLRKTAKEPTRTAQPTTAQIPEIEANEANKSAANGPKDRKAVVLVAADGPRRRGGKDRCQRTCWVGFMEQNRCVQYDIKTGEIVDELTFKKSEEFSGSDRCLHWASYKNLFIKLTNQGIKCFRRTADDKKLELIYSSTEYKFAHSYMNMGSPNLGRNLQITSRGIMLFATGNRFISLVDLENIRRGTSIQQQSCFNYEFSTDIGEFVCSIGAKQALAVITLNGRFYWIKLPSKLRSGQLVVQGNVEGIHIQTLENERTTCLVEVPKYDRIPTSESDGRGWLTGSLSSDAANPLCITFRHHKTLEALDRLNIMKYGSGAGPLHSIRAVPGSKGAVYLVFSDLSYFHLISLTRQKLGIIQGKVSILDHYSSSAAFRVVRDSTQKDLQRKVLILIPTSKDTRPLVYTLRLP